MSLDFDPIEGWDPLITPIEGIPLVMVTSPWMEPSTFLITSRHHAENMHQSPYFFEQVPATTKGEAVKIVQEGMAEVVAWLRANGHDLPTWQDVERREDSRWRYEAQFRAEASLGLLVLNPAHDIRVTDVGSMA